MHSENDKNEPSRFLGDGVSFKAKLIGILEVSEARGDRMCQEALADLKMAIRAAGEHKQRITINIAIDGLRLRDEKTGDSLYHHPVHKISFIAQDMSDSRAFGYIFGSPDTGHRFFGIKTDKAASQVVIAMRDLFQVVFELKKKEIELAKQHIEQKSRFGTTTTTTTTTTSSLFADTSLSSSKSGHTESSNVQESSTSRAVKETSLKNYNGESFLTGKHSSVETSSKTQSASDGAHGGNSEAIADLVDLELELSSIQQGIHQMERITPSDPFGPNKDDPFNSDPFGDSFISFPQKPFLPPPPSSRERSSRTQSDTSSSLFSPKTPKTGDSTATEAQNLFKVSQEDTASCDWFTPTGSDSLFDDAVPTAGSTTDETEKKEPESTPQESNASILSQFDVFTELDPLGTGRSKPYVDKKLFFQELKNPPKKVLKDLVSTQPSDTSLFTANFDQTTTTTTHNNLTTNNQILFPTDPFVESDPFDKTDPFAEADFAKTHDPFDTDFIEDFKVFNKQEISVANKEETRRTKYPIPQHDKLQPLFPSPLSKSPNRSGIFEKQTSLQSNHVSPRNSDRTREVTKQNTFDLKFDDRKFGKISQLHENPSLDMSSEGECAPEPPPRPASNISPIKPPPLPPKKQPGDLTKPPPRPPHTEESHYDYMESYETGPNGLDSFDAGPPLPVPARKSRFDQSDFGIAPQRPKKHHQGNGDEDYLTPVAPPPLLPPQKKDAHFRTTHFRSDGILLPPPKKETSKRVDRHQQNTVGSLLDAKPKSTSPTNVEAKINLTPDTLDITLSQLTLSGLNELASKLKIPPSQLSNMTLVQLTGYLSNYVKSSQTSVPNETDATVPTFQADFAANFNDFNNAAATASKTETYDRYAVFRELLEQEEQNKQKEENNDVAETASEATEPETKTENVPFKPTFENASNTDRYAALRDIIIEDNEVEQKENNLDEETAEEDRSETKREDGDGDGDDDDDDDDDEDDENDENDDDDDDDDDDNEKRQNDLNVDSNKTETEIDDKTRQVESNIIEYDSPQDKDIKDKLNVDTPTKSPEKIESNITGKSPVPVAVAEIIQTNNHLTSGSLSDAVTGSSPEMDNLEKDAVDKKNVENTNAAESWAIFDTSNIREEVKEKQAQSEEGVSPWSSDSKEFGNGSPLDWQQRRDSESEGDCGRKRRDGTWWDTQGEIEGPYDKQKHRYHRRSTDSYDDDWYEAEEDQRPRRRNRPPPPPHSWGRAGGQSSSSRDVSPWEEDEPRARRDDGWRRNRERWDRLHRRDSWDEDDDYEYEEEYYSKMHHQERHGSRDSDRGSRDSDRHSTPRGELPDDWDRGGDQWADQERRHSRRKGPHVPDERWCRADWEREEKSAFPGKDKPGRYSSRYANNPEGKWRAERERKREHDRYYKRDHSQESPWEDEYSNDPDEPPQSPRYLSARTGRNWKRPSSASEMDRKTGEIKSRQPYYVGTGGSDGERDRRYKSNRRSRSRDSQFSEMSSHNRHKPDPGLTLRYHNRNRDKLYSQKFENNFTQEVLSKASKIDVKLEQSNNKKSSTLGRKKGKELTSPKTETEPAANKGNRKQHLMFENDFVNSETDSPVATKTTKFNFENDFETSEAESPTVARHSKYTRSHTMFESEHNVKRNIRPSVKQSVGFENELSKESRMRQALRNDFQEKDAPIKICTSSKPHANLKQKSMFEDDFSPTDKSNDSQCNDDNGISVIPEEPAPGEQRVSFTDNNLEKNSTNEIRKQKHILSKNRMSNNLRADPNLKKSESVNIFARENDPFDDDFFSGRDVAEVQKVDSKTSAAVAMEYKWTEDFDSFDITDTDTNK